MFHASFLCIWARTFPTSYVLDFCVADVFSLKGGGGRNVACVCLCRRWRALFDCISVCYKHEHTPKQSRRLLCDLLLCVVENSKPSMPVLSSPFFVLNSLKKLRKEQKKNLGHNFRSRCCLLFLLHYRHERRLVSLSFFFTRFCNPIAVCGEVPLQLFIELLRL